VLHHAGLIPALDAVIIAVLLAWLATGLSRWRQLTWRDHMDTAINLMPKQAMQDGTWADWKVFARHEEVAQPSLVLLRVRNSGFTSIGAAGVRRAITFTFPGREVKEFTVTDCHRVTREMIQPPGTTDAIVADNRITLPRFQMKRWASFKLLVLLSGTGRGVIGKGRISRGRVVHERRGRTPAVRNIVFGSVLAMLVGVQAGVSLNQGPVLPSSCGTGKLLLEGSTAFAPVAQQIATAYTGVCPAAAVSVSAIATFNGLNAVDSSGNSGGSGSGSSGGGKKAAGPTQIAMSDGPAPNGYPALVGHPVAVIIFGVVVNKQAGVYNLTVAEIRAIFAGTITNWRQVGGANLPVRIVGRTSGSGTRRAFDEKVLDGNEPPFSSYNCVSKDAVPTSAVIRCEVADTSTLLQRVDQIPGTIGYAQVSDAETYPDVEIVKLGGWDPDIGAIEQGEYPFWTVEYLYTYGSPPSGSAAADFLAYVNSDTAKDILRSQDYIPCVDRQQSLLNTLCRP
jgi:phosphate transport system substrate-binding protein